ncbi:DUF3575 domain-containing protein [Amniculibacterium aquaticum]|uniref:DUF3575 domain-containing protein n=1 Tax=Amniculibacterium aquaticum TaxID=2479858 RepID=UPI000F5B521B|nr:DUF3575 domain-containing protein [Amniculibacterium aquaticum]
MKKIFFLTFLLSVLSVEAQNKLYAKGNALFAPFGIINIGLEKQVAPKYTLQAEVFVSPWKSFAGKDAQIFMFGLDGRYYFNEAFKSWYVGANASLTYFKIQKWNYWNDNVFQLDATTKPYINSNLYQEGFGFMLGAVVGYQFQLSEKWLMDFYAGFGSVQEFYKGYDKISGERYDDPYHTRVWNRSGEFLPYKGGVMISYQLK